MILQFTSYNTKSENNWIFRGQLQPFRVNLGSKQKLRCNQEKIPYIFTKFENVLNFGVGGYSLVSCQQIDLTDKKNLVSTA